MNKDRRAFLKSAGLLGAGAAAFPVTGLTAGIAAGESLRIPRTASAANRKQAFNMCGYRAPKIETVRVGFVGLGNRGSAAVVRVNYLEGVVINALCDIIPEKAAKSAAAVGR